MALPKIPEQPPGPKSFKQSVFNLTPVVLTVLSTLLAGLSSSAITRSQYYRSLAAQYQSKASDQWAYYQAKRMRAVDAQNSLDLLQAIAHPAQLSIPGILAAAQEVPGGAALLAQLHGVLDDPQATAALTPPGPTLPVVADAPIPDKAITDAMDAVNKNQSEEQISELLRSIGDDRMDNALLVAQSNLDAFDAAVAPLGAMLDKLHSILDQAAALCASAGAGAAKDVQAAQSQITAARMTYSAARYQREAAYNGTSAELYEVQVHRSSVISDRFKKRSSNFFYGMLVAQAGVLIASFSLTVQRRGPFWALAAIAGAGAIAFGSYVYLFI